VVKNDLTYYEDRSETTVKKVGQKGLSILRAAEVLGYISRSTVETKDLKEPGRSSLDKMPNANKDFDKNVAEIKKKLIPKDETIIIFDEAHFADAKYQEMQKQLIKAGYQVIVMSATFPKKPFSITTSHPRDVYLMNKFEPEYLADGKTERWSKQRTQIFLRTTENE
jgi:hypothetical protein